MLNLQRWVSMPSNEKSPKIDIIQPDGTIGRPEHRLAAGLIDLDVAFYRNAAPACSRNRSARRT